MHNNSVLESDPDDSRFTTRDLQRNGVKNYNRSQRQPLLTHNTLCGVCAVRREEDREAKEGEARASIGAQVEVGAGRLCTENEPRERNWQRDRDCLFEWSRT